MSAGYSVKFQNRDAVSRETLLAAMPGIIEVVVENAQKMTPVRSGRLRKSIKGAVTDGGQAGVVYTSAPHAHLVHEGVKAHHVVAKGHALVIPAGGHVLLRKGAWHPGTRGRPFLTDALRTSTEEVARLLRIDGERIVTEGFDEPLG